MVHGHIRRGAGATAGAALATLLLASCGGGGGGDVYNDNAGVGSSSNNGVITSGLASSASLANVCVAPRAAGTLDPNGQPYNDRTGSVDSEKAWVRSWIDETYLWYQDVRGLGTTKLNWANSATARDYFDKLKAADAKDHFHFFYDTPVWIALSQSGVSYGYGFEVSLVSTTIPRRAVVAYTNPGTTAVTNGIARGDEILTVDGVDLVNEQTQAGVDKINAGLFPDAAGNHTFSVRGLNGNVRSVTMAAGAITSTPVQNVKTLPAPNANVGYMLFNDHIATAEPQLLAAVAQLKAAGITDLVLDIRYNGGGYLDIASELAYMIAGPTATANKTFEKITFNDRNPFGLSDDERTTAFHTTTLGFSGAAGQTLPTLGLSRVFVLVGEGTCSASEAIVNGLRGIGVDVKLIGDTTCGKPYGFYPQDNCNTTYFSIQFQGVNALGQGDYADGFAPTCTVDDDFAHALGDPAEQRLAVALQLRSNGACPAGTASAGKSRAKSTGPASLALSRPALRENRFYRER